MRDLVLPSATAAEFGAEIEAAGAIRLVPIRGGEPDAALADAEILLLGHLEDAPYTWPLARVPAVRWVHSPWAGTDDLLTPEVRARRPVFTNSPGVYAPGMAEYVLWALVELARRMPELHEAQRERRWAVRPGGTQQGLYGKRLGIVGYGAIGRHVAQAAKALGMEVWATRRTPTLTTGEPLDRWLPADALPELLAASDCVVVCASLNDSTRRLIGRDELAAVRPGAVLVNVGRGAILDEDALVEALESGRLGGAALDVTTEEPLPAASPLWHAPNLVLTPHCSGDTPDAHRRAIDLFLANLRLYLAGHEDRLANRIPLEDAT